MKSACFDATLDAHPAKNHKKSIETHEKQTKMQKSSLFLSSLQFKENNCFANFFCVVLSLIASFDRKSAQHQTKTTKINETKN